MGSLWELITSTNRDTTEYLRYNRSKREFQADVLESSITLGIPDFYYMSKAVAHRDWREAGYQTTVGVTGLAPWYMGYRGAKAWEFFHKGRIVQLSFAEAMHGKAYLLRQGAIAAGRKIIPAVTAMGVLYAAGDYLQSAYYGLAGMHIGDLRFSR